MLAKLHKMLDAVFPRPDDLRRRIQNLKASVELAERKFDELTRKAARS